MKSRCPMSTISYNTEQFLIRELNKLIDERVIEFYAFIYHFPEADEKKGHRHLYIIPSTLVDSFTLNVRLSQVDVDNPDKPPLGCINWKHSKFGDWYLYALHDKDYLATMCEERKFHYSKDEFVVSDWDYFNELIHTSDLVKYKSFAKFREMVSSGVNFRELFSNGFIPVQQIVQYKKAYNLMKYGNMDFMPHLRDSRTEKTVMGGEGCLPFLINEEGEIVYGSEEDM